MKSHLKDFRCVHATRRDRVGMLIIIVLVTIVMLSLSAYAFTSLMVAEDSAARSLAKQVQAKYLVDSGVDYIRLFLSADEATIREKGGIWNNEATFRGIAVGADPSNPENLGRFSVVAPGMSSDGASEGTRYGLVDESSKINLNTLPFADNWVPGGGRQLLMALPDMTEEIADAIIDWVDADDETRDYGAESNYYTGMSPPYAAKNGPMDSIDELLLVRGVTAPLLFGADSNRNGVIDMSELGDASSLDADMLLGWANYLTLYSKETNKNPDGLTRVNLNNPDLDQLYTDLRSAFNEEWSRFIIQYRINGPYQLQDDDPEPVSANTPFELDTEAEATTTLNQVLDLFDVYTTADDPNSAGDTLILRSPLTTGNAPQVLPILMMNATTFEGENIPGRINIMQAPRRILASVPGMTEEYLDSIIQLREFELDDPTGIDMNRRFETWIFADFIVDLPTMRVMLPFLCAGGNVYQAEVVGYFDDGIGTSRSEVIVDTTIPIPRILFWRDKSHLDSGYSAEILGVDLVE